MSKLTGFVLAPGRPASPRRIISVFLGVLLWSTLAGELYTEAILISPFFLFSKTKKHFLTVQYTDERGDGKFMMLHMDKSNAEDIVNTAEAQTGQKVTREEER